MAVKKSTAAQKRAPQPSEEDPFAFTPQQQELAPVALPATAAANDAARQAIATINTQLAEFDRVEAGISDLERKYKSVVYAVETADGLKDATAARLEIRKPRFAVEAARKAAKRPVIDLGRDIDARADKINARLLPLENPIDGQIKAQEQKEAARKQALEERIAEIAGTPARCIGKSSAQLQEVLDALDSLPLAEFQEYRERAAGAQQAALVSVHQLLTQARDAEEATRLREEQRQANERREGLQAKVDAIGDVLAFPYRTAARVKQASERLAAVAIGEEFAEFAPAAREKKTQVLAALDARFEELAKAEREVEAAPAPAPPPYARASYGARCVPRADQPDGLTVGGNVIDIKTSGEPTDYEGQRQLRGFIAGAPAERRIDPPDFGAVDAEVRRRPSDAEILAVVAAHYEVTWGEAARWLRTMDLDTALNQIPLEA